MTYKNLYSAIFSICCLCIISAGLYAESDLAAVSSMNNQPLEQQYTQSEKIDYQNIKITLNFEDARVSGILDYLSDKAGLVIIADSYPSGRINLVSKQALSIPEVITLINTILKDQGYAAIQTDRTLKLVSIGEAKYLNIPVTSGNDPDAIAETDDIVTHIIPIRHADATKLKEDISPLISDDTIISSNEASNSLIITDTKANIKRIIKIVKSVDTQMSSVTDVKVFLLEYADAESTADLINNVFEQQTSSSDNSRNQNPFMRMMGGRGGPMGGRGGGESDTSSSTSGATNVPVIADSDERTNAVVVSGPADVLEVIAQVVKELDSNPDEERSLFVYKLKYADADNIKEKLNSLFQELEDINEQNTRNSGGGGRNFGRNESSSSSSSDVSDEVYIESDEDTNALIIMTSSKNYDKIKAVVEELDVPIPQVLIKVLIAELTMTDGTDIGVNWEFLVDERNSSDMVSNLFSYYSPTASEGLVTQIISGDLDVTLRALEENGTLNILSRPYIMTSNNKTAMINVGQQYPYITDSQTTTENTVNNTIEYQTIGITLEVTPNINIDQLVIMDVKPEIIEPQDSANSVEISEGLNATVFDTRTAECSVAVPNGQTVVIGGLMKDKETESVEKVPLLGDLPLLGGAFKRTKTETQKTELLIFLTPQVAKDIDDLKRISDFERSKSKFLKESEGTSLGGHIENMESVYQDK